MIKEERIERILHELFQRGLLGEVSYTPYATATYEVTGPGFHRFVEEETAKLFCSAVQDHKATFISNGPNYMGWRGAGLQFYIGNVDSIYDCIESLKLLDPEDLPRLASQHLSWEPHSCIRYPLVQALAVLQLDGTLEALFQKQNS